METIFSDGKTLEIERILKITVFLPQPCYFCGKEITKMRGLGSDSLVFHSLDGNHENWEPSNKVPTHRGCHMSFHQEREKNTMYGVHRYGEEAPFYGKTHSEETKQKMSKRNLGDKNPMANPKHRAKMLESIRTPECRAKMSEAKMGENNPNYGNKVSPEERKIHTAKGWQTRRARYGPTGRKPKDE